METKMRKLAASALPFIPPETEYDLVNANSEQSVSSEGWAGNLVKWANNNHHISALPANLRQKITADGLINRVDCFNDIRQNLLEMSSSLDRIHQETLTTSPGTTPSKRAPSLAESIWQFSTEWKHDLTAMIQSRDLFRALLKLLYLTEHGPCDCSLCKGWRTHRKVNFDDYLSRIVVKASHLIMEQVNAELQKQSPTWNPDWSGFLRFIFPTMSGLQREEFSQWKLGSFISHHIACIETYWEVHHFLGHRIVPSEIKDLIFDATLRKDQVRKLAALDHQWRDAWHKEQCECTERCLWIICRPDAVPNPIDWSVQIRHVYGAKFRPEYGIVSDHVGDCRCDVPFMHWEEYKALHGLAWRPWDPARLKSGIVLAVDEE